MPTHLLAVSRPDVQDVWRNLDTQGLQKLRVNMKDVKWRMGLHHGLCVLAVMTTGAVAFTLLEILVDSWLAAGMLAMVLTAVLSAKAMHYMDEQEKRLAEVSRFLAPLAQPAYEESCRQMLSLSRSLPACQAYRQAVLQNKREFIVADFHVMQQLQAEKDREKALVPYMALSRSESEVEVAF